MRKIKNILLLLTIISMSFCLTGCVRYSVGITLDRAGNAYVDDVTMVPDEVLPLVENKLSEKINEINSDTEAGAFAEKVQGDGYTGIKVSFKVSDIANNDIQNKHATALNMFKTNNESGNTVDVVKKFFTTSYYIDSNIDFSSDPRVEEYTGSLQSTLTIQIPVKARKHNATEVANNGLTYIWNFDSSDYTENEAFLTYTVLNLLNILWVSLLSIIILTIILFLIFKNRSKKVE